MEAPLCTVTETLFWVPLPTPAVSVPVQFTTEPLGIAGPPGTQACPGGRGSEQHRSHEGSGTPRAADPAPPRPMAAKLRLAHFKPVSQHAQFDSAPPRLFRGIEGEADSQALCGLPLSASHNRRSREALCWIFAAVLSLI